MMKRLFTVVMLTIIFTLFYACGERKLETRTFEKNGINYLVLVNKTNKIPDDWGENLKLTTTENLKGETIHIEKETLEKFQELREDLLKEGIDIEIEAALRTYQTQKQWYDRVERERGKKYAKDNMTPAGYSENQTGLAIEIVLIKNGYIIHGSRDLLKEEEIFNKIHEKMPQYGFIVRYPDNKKEVTGYGYQPWHLRYVGSTELAKEIMNKGTQGTLEEYLEVK